MAAEGRELRLDQALASDNGGTVETRILIVSDREDEATRSTRVARAGEIASVVTSNCIHGFYDLSLPSLSSFCMLIAIAL